MRCLIIISVIVAVAYSAPDAAEESERTGRQFGSYSFSYTGDNLAKSEVRDTDGTTRGAYSFVDEFGQTNQIQYAAGANRGFEVVSHKVQENGQLVELRRGDTPEVIAARESHLRYQAQVKATLPSLQEDHFQPYHFQLQHPQHTFQHEHTFVQDGGPLIYRRIQSPTVEIPPVPVLEVVHPQHLVVTHVPSPVRHPPVVSIVDVIPPQKIVKSLPQHQQQQQHVPPVQVFETEVRQVILPHHIQHFFPEVQQPVHAVHSGVFAQDHAVLVPASHRLPQAHDVQLVDGFTPEVAAARDQHLATFAQVRASLPDARE